MHGLDVDEATEAVRNNDRLSTHDVLFLQEMDEAGTEAVADALNLYYVYASASTHPKSGCDFGNAVLSPAPLEARAVIELPHKARVGGQP